MEVIVKDSILSILPYTEDIFEPFAMILSFIALKHESIIREFRGADISKIESPDDLESKNIEHEEDSSDDYEWI